VTGPVESKGLAGPRPPRQRPPWWPDDEDWPPRGRGPWHRGPGGRRGPWSRGFGCLFGLFFLLGIAALIGIVSTIIEHVGPFGTFARFLAVLLVVAAIWALLRYGRTLRRVAGSLDELAEATERVESGDYAVRVREPVRAPRAMRDLVRGFNEMAARLEVDEAQRRRLLADVSHELRNPLSVVQGNIEAIVDGVHPADPEHLGAILEETRVLARLVDDLRTVTLSEAGSLPLHREPTDVSIVATDAVASFRAAADAAGVALRTAIADDIPLLDVDPIRIREVISNLVANAMRHTPAGGSIDVAARLEGASVVVTVADTGSGISPDLLAHVFDRFAKDPASGGSGLGLAIARGLVDAHGGTIEAESSPGRGSTFRFTLPVA
jgi:two-component system sensor histidine kinase BaeS